MEKEGITKKTLYAPRSKAPEIIKGSKATFHFQTRLIDTNGPEDGKVLDDSRKFGQPFELLTGREFKLEVWESIIRMMGIGEVASFQVQPNLVSSYPFVAKTLRDLYKKKGKGHDHASESSHHCCGMMMAEGATIGYEDLDHLIKNPKPLEFIIELIDVEQPGNYKKEAWQMEPEEKLSSLVKIRESGNEHYRSKKFTEAAEQYSLALGMLEQLALREKPGEPEWKELDMMQVPFLLNYAQCKFQLGEYYEAIEHLSSVLKRDPANVKALFRRGQAHAQVWNAEEAKKDFLNALKSDPSLKAAIDKDIRSMEEKIRVREEREKQKLKGMFS